MPLNLANGVEATAEIILKVAGQGAIYLRCSEREDELDSDVNAISDSDSILMHSAFNNESRLVFKRHDNLKSSGLASSLLCAEG